MLLTHEEKVHIYAAALISVTSLANPAQMHNYGEACETAIKLGDEMIAQLKAKKS